MSKYQITDDEIFVEHPQKTFVLTFLTETRILITSFVNFLNLAMEFELIQSDL